MRDRVATTEAWLPSIPVDWRLAPAKSAFADRREPCRDDDVHLTPSQAYGVLPQSLYMETTGNRVVLNLEGQDDMKHVEPDDFIIHLRSFQGGLERSTYAGKVSTAYTVLRPKAGIDADFFRWVLKSDGYIQELRTTTNQLRDGQSIKYRDFVKVPLPLPPLSEQRAIADYLDRETARIDLLVSKQERLVETLLERRAAVTENAATIGIGSKTPLARSQIEWIAASPDHWSIGRMKYDTNMFSGGTPDTNDTTQWAVDGDEDAVPWVTIGDMSRRDRVENTKKAVTTLAVLSKRLPIGTPETLLLAMYASVGEVAHLGIRATWNQALLGITPKPGRYDTRYLGQVLRAMRRFMLRDVRSSTQSNLNASQVGNFWLPLPPLEEQARIADYLDNETGKIDFIVGKVEQFIEVSKERRSALITAAVTGQIDVRDPRDAANAIDSGKVTDQRRSPSDGRL